MTDDSSLQTCLRGISSSLNHPFWLITEKESILSVYAPDGHWCLPVVKWILSQAHIRSHVYVWEDSFSDRISLHWSTDDGDFTFSWGLKAVVDVYPLNVVRECCVWQ